MALQVFTAGQTLTASQMNTLQASSYNYALSTVSTSTYTILSSDAGKLIIFTNNSDPVQVTFPAGLTIDTGDTVEIVYAGTGTLDLIADTGVTLNSEGSLLTIGTRYGRVSATKTATDVFLVSWMTAVTEAEIGTGAVTETKIGASAVTAAKIATSVAGNGLAGGGGTALSVNVDDSTIEINSDSLRVKDAGITSAKLASAVAGNGLSGGAGSALAVNVDGSTLEINTDSLRVKDAGITSAKLATSLSLTTPTLGVASATSINKVAITAPATSATLTLANGSTLATSGGNSVTLTSTGATNVTLPTTGTLATLAGVEQLENKTLVSPTITGGTITAGEVTVLIFEGSTPDANETTLTVIDPTADRTITLPNASGTVALLGTIALGTDTTGNYMSGVSAGTGVSVSHTPGEGSSATISIGQAVGTTDNPTFAGVTADTVRIGITAASEIDTTAGNLILDSFTGTTQIDDNVVATGTITARAASTQDSVVLQGRSGGSSSYAATLTPTTLSASRTFTLPNVSGTIITTGDSATVSETMINYTTVPQQTVSTLAPSGGKQHDIWIKVV